jgi:hypothetical protein
VSTLAGDPKINIFTSQLANSSHLAGDPKRKGCGSLLDRELINLYTEIAEIINSKVVR